MANAIVRWLLVAVISCFAFGCSLQLPAIVTAQASEFSSARLTTQWDLTPDQTTALLNWLQGCSFCWRPSVVTYAPKFVVHLKYVGGESGTLNVTDEGVVYYDIKGQLERSVSEQEMLRLVSSLKHKP